MIFKFASGSGCNLEKTAQLRSSTSATTFRDVGWDRSSRSLDLARQSVQFLFGETSGRPVDGQRQFMTLVPHFKLLEVLQVALPEKLTTEETDD